MAPDYSELLQRIREAAGDPNGKLMQDELVAHIASLHRLAALAPSQGTSAYGVNADRAPEQKGGA